jgi:hypothetical protein
LRIIAPQHQRVWVRCHAVDVDQAIRVGRLRIGREPCQEDVVLGERGRAVAFQEQERAIVNLAIQHGHAQSTLGVELGDFLHRIGSAGDGLRSES